MRRKGEHVSQREPFIRLTALALRAGTHNVSLVRSISALGASCVLRCRLNVDFRLLGNYPKEG